jgi:hypothetical protein
LTEPDEIPAADADRFERHRALVRETDRRFATVYGAGGAAVLGTGAAVLVIAFAFGALGTVLPWVLAVTVVLIALFVLRVFVNKRREALKAQVTLYCEVNDLDWRAIRDYYEGEGIYPYFVSLFDDRTPRAS